MLNIYFLWLLCHWDLFKYLNLNFSDEFYITEMVFQYEMFHMTVMSLRYSRKYLKQCCGAGAGGAEIILRPGAGAENKF